MPELYIGNRKIESVFQLLGSKEDDMTYSIGFAFSNCQQFLTNFLASVNAPPGINPGLIQIRLQRSEREQGRTDIEIIHYEKFHYIIEAKRGWTFPSESQLQMYVSRNSFSQSTATDKRIFVFNESVPAYKQAFFIHTHIGEIPVHTVSWHQLASLCHTSLAIGRNAENRLLKELALYLEKLSTMQKKDSNWVYIVSLAKDKPEEWNITWRDIVNVKRRYFHPVGGTIGGWPAEPPNYIAFRYDGKLQSIHHIDKYEVFINPSEHIPEVPSDEWNLHYLYHLGPAIKPAHEVRSGEKIIRSMRVWAMIDLLLTSKTIQDARDLSFQR